MPSKDKMLPNSRMKIYRSSLEVKKFILSPVIAIGNFDGVHLGHKEIFTQIKKRTSEVKGTSVIYTFYPPPIHLLHPEMKKPQINTCARKTFTNRHLQVFVR